MAIFNLKNVPVTAEVVTTEMYSSTNLWPDFVSDKIAVSLIVGSPRTTTAALVTGNVRVPVSIGDYLVLTEDDNVEVWSPDLFLAKYQGVG